jgi:formylmethanofuran dehydrogenase subunit A
MITQLKNARVFDPAHKKNGVVEDIYISQGRIVAKPSDAIKISTSLD